jgi:hypothetical protein
MPQSTKRKTMTFPQIQGFSKLGEVDTELDKKNVGTKLPIFEWD